MVAMESQLKLEVQFLFIFWLPIKLQEKSLNNSSLNPFGLHPILNRVKILKKPIKKADFFQNFFLGDVLVLS